MHKRFYSLGAVIGLSLLLSACGAKSGAPSNQPAPSDGKDHLADAPAEVQSLYKGNCLSCHGPDLSGRVGPNSNLQHVGARMAQDGISKQITNGGKGMMAFGSKLKPEEIKALSEWLAAKKVVLVHKLPQAERIILKAVRHMTGQLQSLLAIFRYGKSYRSRLAVG